MLPSVATVFIGVAGAAPLQTTLMRPIAERVAELRNEGRRGYVDLAKICFDRAAPLKVRWRAVTTMGRLDHQFFKPALERALTSPEWFLRNAGLIASLGFERARAVAAATRALGDQALVVRTQAVRNLIALNAREAEARLWRELDDPRNFGAGHHGLWIRGHLAEALAKFTGPGRARAFERLLNDQDRRLHKWAIRGLETTTGFKLTERDEDVDVARGKWLARLRQATI